MSVVIAPSAASIKQQVALAVNEDVGSGDISAQLIPMRAMVKATIVSREPMVLCGSPWLEATFEAIDADIQMQWQAQEGQWLERAQPLVTLIGRARGLLSGERVALNFLQTLSATATQARAYAECLKGTACKVLDTRKTIPGMRLAQKYAVRCGGGENHRFGLYDAFLIKENHIAACGSITAAIMKARSFKRKVMIEVEVENLDQFQEALSLHPDRIMLDNFTLSDLKSAVTMKEGYRCELEASGNIGLHNAREIALSGVDFISVGAISKSINAIDLSMRIEES